MKPNDPLLFFIQKIRDEAHRFAITAHRSKRWKTSLESIFSEITGIGPKRKKILLNYFGSLEKIKNSTKKELKSVPDIPEKIINQIYDFFHSQ